MAARAMRQAVALVVAALVVAGCGRPTRVNAAGPESEVKAMAEEGSLDDGPGRIVKSDAEWRRELTPERYRITRLKGTERPFTGRYWDHKGKGVYTCVGCGLPLFGSDTKYDSGCGWPSYWRPVDRANVVEKTDTSHGMVRTETLCARCGAHLGHVFDDGPEPTGLRYCINSASLDFEPSGSQGSRARDAGPPKTSGAKAMFAAGCFWGVEAAFRGVEGVVNTAVGYSGGSTKHPTYGEVCSGETGHAETVLVDFDPAVVSYEELLAVFWRSHDPTQVDRQGPDVGTQYRSAIFCFDDEQRRAAEASKALLERSGAYRRPIATDVTAAPPFYRAEEYHQRYYEKHGMKGCAAP